MSQDLAPKPTIEEVYSTLSDRSPRRKEEDELFGQQSKNKLALLRTYGKISVALMIVFTFVFVVLLISSVFIWAWHYLVPEEWRWLCDEDLNTIQSIMFSGSLGLIYSIAQRRAVE